MKQVYIQKVHQHDAVIHQYIKGRTLIKILVGALFCKKCSRI